MFELTVSRFYKNVSEHDKSTMLGFADLALVNSGTTHFVIKGIKLFQRKDDQSFFLGFPTQKGKEVDANGKPKYYDQVFPVTAEARTTITNMVVDKAKETWNQQGS